MSITRLFDIAHNSLKKFPKDDVLATKYDGKWEKISTSSLNLKTHRREILLQ